MFSVSVCTSCDSFIIIFFNISVLKKTILGVFVGIHETGGFDPKFHYYGNPAKAYIDHYLHLVT